VRECETRGTSLKDLPLDVYTSASELFAEDVKKVLDFSASLASRKSHGGTAPEAVEEQISQAERALAAE